MSLAIALKSALTFLHRRNPEFARWPDRPVPRRAVFVPLSHQFTVEVGRQKNTLQKSSLKIRNKTRKTAEREEEEGGGGWQRPGEPPASGLHWFLF